MLLFEAAIMHGVGVVEEVLGFVILRDVASASVQRRNIVAWSKTIAHTMKCWTSTYFNVFIGAAAPQTRRADSHDAVSSGGAGPAFGGRGFKRAWRSGKKERKSRIKNQK